MSTGDQEARRQAGTGDRQVPGAGSEPPTAPAIARKGADSNAPQEGGQPHVSKISREDAERNLAPDPDPDDPVSP